MTENLAELLQKYKGVAEYLSDNANVALIDHLKKMMEEKKYYLPFIGQFSAGKSKLINRIIGKEVLPVKSVETTAFLTFISYSETESATIEFVDGTKEKIDIDTIKQLDYKNTKDAKPIAELRYSAPIELLKSGLTIVDTPGVNTLVMEHVKMTEELLQNSQYIVYVCSSPISNDDKVMIKKIDNLGIEPIFARTHMDNIHQNEEDAEATIKKETASIEEILNKKIFFYPLCNEPTSADFDRWSGKFECFKEYISLLLGTNIEQIYEWAVRDRLAILKTDFEKKLQARLDLIISSSDKTEKEMLAVLDKLSKHQASINGELDRHCDIIRESAKMKKMALDSELKILGKHLTDTFQEKVDDMEGDKDFADTIRSTSEDYWAKAQNSLNEKASSAIFAWAKEIIDGVHEKMEIVDVNLSHLGINFNPDFNVDTVTSYDQQMEACQTDVAEKYHDLVLLRSSSESELAKYGVEKEKLDELIKQYDDLIAQSDNSLREAIESYVPHYVEQGGQLGRVLKRVGQVADIGMLLIPAAGWEKASTMLAKKANALAKTGSILGKNGAMVLRDMSNGAKVMAEADVTLDIAKIIGYVKDGEGSAPLQTLPVPQAKAKISIFDYLSLSYWFEKLGDMIDPTEFVEDQQYKQEYNNIIKRLNEEKNLRVRQQVEIIKKRRKITDAEEQERLNRELCEKEERRMQHELEQEKIRIAEKEKRDRWKKIHDNSIRLFRKNLEKYLDILYQRIIEEIDSVTTSVVESMKSFVNSQLDDVERQLHDIAKKRADASHDVSIEKEMMQNFLLDLRIADECDSH